MGVVTEKDDGDNKPGAASCVAGGDYHIPQDISVLSTWRTDREGREGRGGEGRGGRSGECDRQISQ